MNIVFIIGNGFDINLGMKTRYSDFYEYYQTIPSDGILLNNLKNTISNKLKDWSDLELSLGEYTEHLNSTEEIDEVIFDIGEKLSNYLSEEEKKIDFSKVDKQKLHEYLSFPEKVLLKADSDEIVEYKNKWKHHDWSINIITLNYTQVLESLLDNKIINNKIGTHNNASIFLRGIQHLHGYLNDRMIMGVNDKSQIKNSVFHENQDVLETLIKSNCNKAQKHNVDNLCTNQIKQANLICLFGSSIGETDNIWWELIGNKLKDDSRLIIFTRCEDINPRTPHLKARKERALKRLFLTRTKLSLSEEEKKIIEDRIYIGVNCSMFKDILKE
ncbi:Bacteriophage abortive infection AbiH [Flavobacterium aquidurense]|uniref:Bacteriophage abortive infection AbiH n=1 Tax=Flavobacterium frigidimaris TaxID=262320 RepID=A0ABX4BWF3_FLAFR|nr:AbiH family protein [Flavobacterium frigidimaris]OXA81863.1 hypothetical protein B0A65_02190 [Flavobacterium frigidimaris]SDZ34381.1 Bacteriophage abortive infection AbiH [Flavobacterium aquidurense]